MLEELGIKRIRLDLPFRLNHVNCFLAEGKDGYVVIDTGLHNETTVKHWSQVLQDKEISDIYITHYHPDHFGYAGGLQKKHQARLSMSKVDAENVLSAWDENFLNQLLANYKRCAIPEEVGQAMLDNTVSFVPLVTPYPTIDYYFKERDRVQIGRYEYEILFTPGHSDGLITFYNKEKGVLLSTDHILPRITPNISYWFHGDDNPLATYIQSLDKIRALDAQYVIPSHGDPFYDANKRIDEIKAHHKERLSLLLDLVKERETVYELCQGLFDFELTIHETRFAIGETIAHLEYLRHLGEIDREAPDNVWHYYVK